MSPVNLEYRLQIGEKSTREAGVAQSLEKGK